MTPLGTSTHIFRNDEDERGRNGMQLQDTSKWGNEADHLKANRSLEEDFNMMNVGND